jgi:hypothetical protein
VPASRSDRDGRLLGEREGVARHDEGLLEGVRPLSTAWLTMSVKTIQVEPGGKLWVSFRASV